MLREKKTCRRGCLRLVKHESAGAGNNKTIDHLVVYRGNGNVGLHYVKIKEGLTISALSFF